MKLRVASPCLESWERMRGVERVRFCGRCRLNVYNLSEMSSQEVDALLRRKGERVCARFYQRRDGTVMTKDCRPRWQRILRLTGRAAALVTTLCSALLSWGCPMGCVARQGEPVMPPAKERSLRTRWVCSKCGRIEERADNPEYPPKCCGEEMKKQ